MKEGVFIEKFEKETEFDEGGIHYIVFAPGEVGLFDEYRLTDDIEGVEHHEQREASAQSLAGGETECEKED